MQRRYTRLEASYHLVLEEKERLKRQNEAAEKVH